eukprot:5719368-Pleurochrysis_carterae.AAC.1
MLVRTQNVLRLLSGKGQGVCEVLSQSGGIATPAMEYVWKYMVESRVLLGHASASVGMRVSEVVKWADRRRGKDGKGGEMAGRW